MQINSQLKESRQILCRSLGLSLRNVHSFRTQILSPQLRDTLRVWMGFSFLCCILEALSIRKAESNQLILFLHLSGITVFRCLITCVLRTTILFISVRVLLISSRRVSLVPVLHLGQKQKFWYLCFTPFKCNKRFRGAGK